ncbi:MULTISPECIES: hypothetical protein [unclassified Brevibacterium]|uniref:hypothetical protein n=1 Tax=unclassified Brevibacterium TaxID=2614124 RepID=UPI001092F459|nr:hypothetical protein [Brevibacterium sp. S22]TGD29170.1 hypothetical protein EB835_16700 [Brevibacterium sp. S22]
MHSRRFLSALAGPLIGVFVLAGCSHAPDDFDRTPEQVTIELDAVDSSDLQLPLIIEPLELVEPGWDLPPAHLGEVFLSAAAGDERLDFSAVDVHGSTLWQAQRPSGCTGFTISVGADGTPLAVLTDSESSTDCDEDVTASAYDLETGEQVWGPVDVPGPMRGPGTVFAAEDAEPAEALALDPATGEAVQDGSSDVRRLGEYRGTILSIDGERLRATGEQSWELSLPDNGWNADELRAVAEADPGEDVIALDAGDGVGPVLDRETGELLDGDARGVAQDANTGAIVTLGKQGLTVIDDTGKNELPVSVPQSVDLEAAVGGLIYLREGGTLRVHNAATGSLARGYPADGSGVVAVPAAFTPDGLGTVQAGDRTLLATDRVVEETGES